MAPVLSHFIGNLTTYRDGLSFSWQMGRQMATATKNGTTYSYKYNNEGLRVSKTVGSTTTYYTWADGKITSQTDGTNTLYFRYDDTGAILGFELNGIAYYYVQNIQGDIIGILDASGNCVVEYTYDSWGKLLATTGSMASTVGLINPLRYRGYYYDTDTGLYYLQSRYYDSVVGRFVNADDTEILTISQNKILGANLFAYCSNNPVNCSDPSGFFALKLGAWLIILIDIALIFIPIIFSVNRIMKTGRVGVTAFSKITLKLAKVISKALLKVMSRKSALILVTILEGIGKSANLFSKISIGFLVEYLADCADGKRDHIIDFNKKLKFQLIF